MDNKVLYGQFFTLTNPFNVDVFYKWIKTIPDFENLTILEPFAGSNNLVKMISDLGLLNKWKCYDIEPTSNEPLNGYITERRDTLEQFPTGYKVAITNPPYLAKNSATRRGLTYQQTNYDDVYKFALDKMLSNVDYIAAIIPESFITSELFHDRIFAIILLNCRMFSDTECPVCLALFKPHEEDNDFLIYRQNKMIGKYSTLKKKNIKQCSDNNKWKTNDINGNIGIVCIDNTKGPSIKFVHGTEIDPSRIKTSSRSITRVSGLPENIDITEFLDECNKNLELYRKNTKDVFLTPFKGLRADSMYRRRLDFATAKNIMSYTLQSIIKKRVRFQMTI